MKNTVFILQHQHTLDGYEDVKMIGVYSLRSSADAAVDRLKSQPGFCNAPLICDPDKGEDADGFYIGEYELDKDFWVEG